MEYEKIDAILKYLENNSEDTEKDLLTKGCTKNDVAFVRDRLLKNNHKKLLPKICVISYMNS